MKVILLSAILYAIYCNGISQKQEPPDKGCKDIFDYFELLEKGLNDEEMKEKLPCTLINGRQVIWEENHFKRGELTIAV